MRLGADHGARAFRRQVFLANVHALVTGSDADVGAIVHDQGHAIAQHAANFAGMAKHLARITHLVAILQPSHAAGGKFTSVVDDGSESAQRRRETGDVEDGVQLG